MFNTEFNEFLPPDKAQVGFYPKDLQKEIDEINVCVYDDFNSKCLLRNISIDTSELFYFIDGVYKTGVARNQQAYETAVKPLFESLDRLEKILAGKQFLFGDRMTEADIRLYPTIVRFDSVYHGHFKCNYRTIQGGYPDLHRSVAFILEIIRDV